MMLIGLLFKVLILIIEAIYVIFSFVITRQVGLLNESFETQYKYFFTVISLVHFGLSITVLTLSILLF